MGTLGEPDPNLSRNWAGRRARIRLSSWHGGIRRRHGHDRRLNFLPSGHAQFGTAAHGHKRADFIMLATGSPAATEPSSFYAGLAGEVFLRSRRKLRAFACSVAVLDAGAPPATKWHGLGLPPEAVTADHGLAAAKCGRVGEVTARAASCVLSPRMDLARQSVGTAMAVPVRAGAGLTRWQSNAIGGIPKERSTTSGLTRLLGVSSATATSVARRLIGCSTPVRDQDALDRRPVRRVATGLEVRLASDQRRSCGGHFAALFGSDGADEGGGPHSAGHAGIRGACGFGVEPVRHQSVTRRRSANGTRGNRDTAALRNDQALSTASPDSQLSLPSPAATGAAGILSGCAVRTRWPGVNPNRDSGG
jgi:hypothetical protein